MTEFVIDRSKWYCGKGAHLSSLLTPGKKMCCLGFVSEQCGVDKDTMYDITSPSLLLNDEREKVFPILYGKNAKNRELINLAMIINDNSQIKNRDREEMLFRLFNFLGYTLTFIGEYDETCNQTCD